MSEATDKQKRFLKALGQKSVAGLSKEAASELIQQLLESETNSGKTFRCPYCKQSIGPRPKSTRKKCPHCGNTFNHICGKFLTDEQLTEADQKIWFKDQRDELKDIVRDDWEDERDFRREYKEKNFVGYLLRIGPGCPHASHLNGLLVVLEDAKANLELLPPYSECREETCQCEFELVSDDGVASGTRIAEMEGKPSRISRSTSQSSRTAVAQSGSLNAVGCVLNCFGWLVACVAYTIGLALLAFGASFAIQRNFGPGLVAGVMSLGCFIFGRWFQPRLANRKKATSAAGEMPEWMGDAEKDDDLPEWMKPDS